MRTDKVETARKKSEWAASGKDPDLTRRRLGAFFTPTLWVDEAHKTLDRVLGPNWREECVVWDPAAGTGNLTRDYAFSDLILSTAEKPDVDVIIGQGYNPGASVFQFDFLNPNAASSFFVDAQNKNEIPDAVDARLRAASVAGKRLVFLMNPPYAEDGVAGTKGETRAGVAATTLVAEACRKAKFGRVSRQLYAQFMYHCSQLAQDYGFANHTIALFSKPTFMCSGSYRPFRNWWYGRYACKDAWLFQASHFADVSGAWGVSFTVWNSPGKTDSKTSIPCTLKDVLKGTFKVDVVASKAVYNSDDLDASGWVNGPGHGPDPGADTPKMSSGLSVRDGSWGGGSAPGALGVMCSMGNNMMASGDAVFMLSCKPTHKGLRHFDIIHGESWRRAIALYAARKLIASNWINDKDEYLAPVVSVAYEQWVDDCHVYALLHSSNNCTAMRNVPYKGKSWTIHNHFFWRTQADTLAALDTKATGNHYRDCKAHPSKDVFGNPVVSTPDPYMACVLPSLNLSPEAVNVLTLLDALWVKSLPVRENYAAGKPELHLVAWDAGVYQAKHLWRDLFPSDWQALQAAFRQLAEKLRPGVYEHGFLKP